MIITYKGHEVGGLGKYGSDNYMFTILTKKTHLTREFKAKSLNDALKKCEEICREMEMNNKKT